MPDKKLTDNEIVKALNTALGMEHISIYCANIKNEVQTIRVLDIIDLINRLQAENKILSALAELGNTRANDYRVMRDRALKAEAENERLKNAYKQCAYERDAYIEIENTAIVEAKAEAYKEFAQKLESIIMWSPKNHISITAKDVREILKELVGEDNA